MFNWWDIKKGCSLQKRAAGSTRFDLFFISPIHISSSRFFYILRTLRREQTISRGPIFYSWFQTVGSSSILRGALYIRVCMYMYRRAPNVPRFMYIHLLCIESTIPISSSFLMHSIEKLKLLLKHSYIEFWQGHYWITQISVCVTKIRAIRTRFFRTYHRKWRLVIELRPFITDVSISPPTPEIKHCFNDNDAHLISVYTFIDYTEIRCFCCWIFYKNWLCYESFINEDISIYYYYALGH